MRYMYGSVTVRTATVEAESEEAALEILKDTAPKISVSKKVLTENKLTWGETPDRDTMVERDGLLRDFLHLVRHLPTCSAADFIILPDAKDGAPI